MSRRSITIRLREELIEELDREAEDNDISRSEYVRQILQDRDEVDELREEIERLEERLNSREARIDELETQLRRRSQIEEKVEEMALEVREERESSNAPFFVKWAKWWRNR